jgi:hypothetical protein
MTVRVKNVGMPSFVGLYLADDREIRLYGTNEPRREGVEMRRDGLDLVMTFTGVPLDLLRQSGRFQVIDVYR